MFFTIPNLRSSTVSELPKPWEFKPDTPPPYDDRNAFIKWRADFGTRHAFISGYEGTSPLVRLTKTDNPVFKMHSLIVDYDGRLPDNAANHVASKPAGEYMPSYVVETAVGGRLVWLFESPLLLASETQAKEFLKIANKMLRLKGWLPGLDTEALSKPEQYFEVGKAWHAINPDGFIPSANLELWLLKASTGMRFDNDKRLEYVTPIESVAEEVESRYPDRWAGTFALGARGVRFWDPNADNPSAAVVTEEGMICFTGDQAFVSWKQIFGAKFMEPFEASYVAGIVKDSAYDGRSFWLACNGRWEEWSKEDFSQELRCRGYDGRKAQGKPASELDIIENMIKKDQRVGRALPFLFFKPGIIAYEGVRYLNTSTVTPAQPSPPVCEGNLLWTDGPIHFPFIHELMMSMFRGEEDDAEQMTGLLAWLRYFYYNSLEGTPCPGHAIVLAGPPGKGKTLFSKAVIGGLMGGHSDAQGHLVDGDKWTERVIDSPVMRIDDSLATSDVVGLRKFSNRIKKYTANAEMAYEEKYRKAGMVPWFGRIIITCNMDAESLRILPDMDMSTKDKISLFKASPAQMKFPDWQSIDKILAHEIPIFARFLVDWTIPEDWIAKEKRYGVVPFHHPELFEESQQHGVGPIIELLTGFMETLQKDPDKNYWEGTATELHRDLHTYSAETIRAMSTTYLGMQLGKMQKNGFNLYKFKNKARLNVWRISHQLNKLEKEVIEDEPATT
jgi:hypothetical protein